MARSSSRTNPANQQHGVHPVSSELVRRLNAIDPGLGTLLAEDTYMSRMAVDTRLRAAAGQHGTVVLAEQKRGSTGVRPAAMDVKGGEIVGGQWTSKLDAFVTLGQMLAYFTCDRFAGHPSGFPGWFEDCVDQRDQEASVVAGDGRIHAMWGYTWDVPNFEDVTSGDPGVSEFGYGTYWQMQIPETTVLDSVSFRIPFDPGLPVLAEGPVGFALYSLDAGAAEATLVVKSETVQAFGLGEGRQTLALEERTTLDAGLYALAYIGPCFDMSIINALYQEWTMVNELWELPRYGNFELSGPYDPAGTANLMPETITPTEEFNLGVVPLTYWHDSEQFG